MYEKPQHIGELIKRISEISEKNANNDLQSRDVTLAQMKVLIVLENAPDGSCTLKELERLFGSTQATIAGTAARLERKGLVEGYMDPEDRRIKHVRLSEKGLQLCRSTKDSIDARERWLVRMLDESEQAELMRMLLAVYEGLDVSYESEKSQSDR